MQQKTNFSIIIIMIVLCIIECITVFSSIEVDWRKERDQREWCGGLAIYGNSEYDEKAENWKSNEQWQSYWLQSIYCGEMWRGLDGKPVQLRLFVGRRAKQVIETSFFLFSLSLSPFFPILYISLFPLIPWIFFSLFSVADYYHSDTVPLLLLYI